MERPLAMPFLDEADTQGAIKGQQTLRLASFEDEQLKDWSVGHNFRAASRKSTIR